MMVLLFELVVVAVVYFVAVYFVVKYTVDKLGARSGLFGAGLVNVVIGFTMYAIVSKFGLLVDGFYYVYWEDDLSLLYCVVLFVFLAMGISGIVMVAVDLLKAVRELGGFVSRSNEKPSVTQSVFGVPLKSTPAPQGQIPTWKRIQMEQEAQSKE